MPKLYFVSLLSCVSRHFDKCGVVDPSWMELKHFLNFLDAQFEDCERSIFCNVCINELPGFKAFVVKFMLKMSKVSQVRLRNLRFTHIHMHLAYAVICT